jgi:phosphate uptake regulator
MTMEIRKLQVTGGSTHVVSLPKKWIDRNRLKRSDTVAIHEEPDGSLLLIPHGEAKTAGRSITVELPEAPTQADIARRLVGAYLAGADEIRVKSVGRLDAAVRTRVREMSRSLVGVEILDEGAQGLTLQDLVGVSEMDLRKSLTRMQRLARLMFDDAMRALESADHELGAEVTRRDDELDRLLWMVSKQMHALLEQPRLAANLDVRPAEALNLFMAARALERIGDHAAKLGANVAALEGVKVPAPVVASLSAQANVVRKLWDDAFASLKRPDFDQASKAADLGEEAAAWRGEFPALISHLGPGAVGPLTLIADSLDRTRGYAIDVAEMAMNQVFQQMV